LTLNRKSVICCRCRIEISGGFALNQNHEEHRHGDGFITALAFGGFLILVGLLFVLTPDLWQKINDFFNSITTATVPLSNSASNISLPAPADPAAHKTLYTAVMQFDIAFGILQILIFGLRIWMHSRTRRIAETLGNAVFWLGAAVLVNVFLFTGTLSGWFEYWAALIIIVGISLIARAAVHFAKR
jgi:hypothetical protein